MAHYHDDRQPDSFQAGCAVRPRSRLCLLKDCEQLFEPPHWRSRYCGETCAKAARQHSLWLAAREYRTTAHGKEKRSQQCQRRRQRLKDTPRVSSETAMDAGGEGHHKEDSSDFLPCHRPGCYQRFSPPASRVPKKFCCALCRQALRRVLRRERRWRRRLRNAGRGGLGW